MTADNAPRAISTRSMFTESVEFWRRNPSRSTDSVWKPRIFMFVCVALAVMPSGLLILPGLVEKLPAGAE